MPLIVMLILTIIIPTIIYVGKNIIQQPTETAEIEKQEETNEEKISAASVNVEAGDSYTIPKDGIYKIELHGGKSKDITLENGTIISGNKGSKVTGYVRLNEGDVLDMRRLCLHSQEVATARLGDYNGADCVELTLGEKGKWQASGGPGVSLFGDSVGGTIKSICNSGHVKIDYFSGLKSVPLDVMDKHSSYNTDSSFIGLGSWENGSCRACGENSVVAVYPVEGVLGGGHKTSLYGTAYGSYGPSGVSDESVVMDLEVYKDGSTATTNEGFCSIELAEYTLTVHPNGGTYNGSLNSFVQDGVGYREHGHHKYT